MGMTDAQTPALYTSLPAGFLECSASELIEVLPGPSLVHLPGSLPSDQQQSIFVSVLLHGNETSGLTVLQELLQRARPTSRDLIIFVGNIEAAAQGVRRLDPQPDFNRIWAAGETPEHQLAQAVLDYAASNHCLAAIDIHNNTGKNPLYGCINHVDRRFIQLAKTFSETIVFFSEPHEVIANNLARYCPAVTLECGPPGDPAGIHQAVTMLEHCLYSADIYAETAANTATEVFHTVARMRVAKDCRISFGEASGAKADFYFPENLDECNFRLLAADQVIGQRGNDQARIEVINNGGHDVSEQYFYYRDGEIRTRKAFLPSMLTLDEKVIRQDCLGYIMERYPLDNQSLARPAPR